MMQCHDNALKGEGLACAEAAWFWEGVLSRRACLGTRSTGLVCCERDCLLLLLCTSLLAIALPLGEDRGPPPLLPRRCLGEANWAPCWGVSLWALCLSGALDCPSGCLWVPACCCLSGLLAGCLEEDWPLPVWPPFPEGECPRLRSLAVGMEAPQLRLLSLEGERVPSCGSSVVTLEGCCSAHLRACTQCPTF